MLLVLYVKYWKGNLQEKYPFMLDDNFKYTERIHMIMGVDLSTPPSDHLNIVKMG
jgi:hypothetical protein